MPDPQWDDTARDDRWDHLKRVRDQVLVALEGMRKQKQIGSGQEASVRIEADAPAERLDPALLTTICMVSEVEVVTVAERGEVVTATKSPHAKCERCWNLRPTVGEDATHPTLCDRCARVVSSLPAEG